MQDVVDGVILAVAAIGPFLSTIDMMEIKNGNVES